MKYSVSSALSSLLLISQTLGLEQRSAAAIGGWGLLGIGNVPCPDGTTGHMDLDVQVCCPTGYTSVADSGVGSRVCCPSGTILSSLDSTVY
jgi:hypothetical protein